MRVAVADIGTNSTRLLIADVVDGRVVERERLLTITRLGDGVDHSGYLSEAAIDRVLAALRMYADHADAHRANTRLAVATSAVRDATNRDAFLNAVCETSFQPRLLSGQDEAALTFAGVMSASAATASTVVIDVGGGSTELILGGPGGVISSCSLQAGCVRMSERYLRYEAVTPKALSACRAALQALLTTVPSTITTNAHTGIGVAGTATTAAAIALGLEEYDPALIHGATVTRTAIGEQARRLGAMTLAEREQVAGLEPERAPVIVAGLIVLEAVLDHLALSEITVSEFDILQGAALSLIQ